MAAKLLTTSRRLAAPLPADLRTARDAAAHFFGVAFLCRSHNKPNVCRIDHEKFPTPGFLLGTAPQRVPRLCGVGITAMANISDASFAAMGIKPRRGLAKRALFGLALLVTWVAGGACLLHASIEADGDPADRSYREASANDKAD
jgi:hypothetical protein